MVVLAVSYCSPVTYVCGWWFRLLLLTVLSVLVLEMTLWLSALWYEGVRLAELPFPFRWLWWCWYPPRSS